MIHCGFEIALKYNISCLKVGKHLRKILLNTLTWKNLLSVFIMPLTLGKNHQRLFKLSALIYKYLITFS